MAKNPRQYAQRNIQSRAETLELHKTIFLALRETRVSSGLMGAIQWRE
jgi:hypothetical protein